MIYSEDFPIRWHETDLNRAVRPSALLAVMQETANHQLHTADMDLDRLRDEQRVAFILSRIAVKIYEPLHAYENITAQTWVCFSHGFNFERCFRVLREGRTVAEGVSSWGLLSLDDRRLVRVDELEFPVTPEEKLQFDDLPERFRVPPVSEMEFAGKRAIRYSDLDYNGHMNNTKYPDMLADFLPAPEETRVNGFSISFLKEAKYGDELSLYRAPFLTKTGGAGYCFCALNGAGETCLNALLTVLPA